MENYTMKKQKSWVRRQWDNFGPQFVKFAVVGGIGTGISYILLYAFVQYYSVYYIYASWISLIIGQCISFVGYRWWAFVLKTKRMMYSTKFQFIIHWGIWGLGFAIATVILYTFTEYLHIWYLYSQVFATVISSACNFLSHKYFTYRPK